MVQIRQNIARHNWITCESGRTVWTWPFIKAGQFFLSTVIAVLWQYPDKYLSDTCARLCLQTANIVSRCTARPIHYLRATTICRKFCEMYIKNWRCYCFFDLSMIVPSYCNIFSAYCNTFFTYIFAFILFASRILIKFYIKVTNQFFG